MDDADLERRRATIYDPAAARRLGHSEPIAELAAPALIDKPFETYARLLTARGGFMVRYKDQACNALLTGLRGLTWLSVSVLCWQLLKLPPPWSFGVIASLLYATHILTNKPILVQHSIEVHPDGLIIDDEMFFSLNSIGDNWPSLQMLDDDPDRLVVCGIAGVQFICYATVNRIHEQDRTPEVLASDLDNAMEQLWGRRDAMFPELPISEEY